MSDLDATPETSDDDLDESLKVPRIVAGPRETYVPSTTASKSSSRTSKAIPISIPNAESSQSTTSDERDAAISFKAHTHSEEADLWSSDDNAKASRKRKRATGNTNKSQGAKGEGHEGSKRKKANGRGRPKKPERAWGDKSDEDQLMEYTLPDYLQKRRSNFDRRYEKFREAGLKLPPRFEEVEFSDDERLEELRERPDFPRGTPSAPYKDVNLPMSLGLIPASIAQWLRGYQVEGTAFLHRLFIYQTGGILGDDMGLGKTVQVIAFLTAAFGKTGDERDAKRMRKMRRAKAEWYPRVLVICPGTLIENWKNEFDRWGWWHVDAYHGADKDDVLDVAISGRLEVMITTYSTYRLNKNSINMINWDCVVADECHQIKSRTSEVTQAMNEVNALCRIGLTGTAIQNSYDELWTLLNWTNPGKLGPITTWKQSISVPLKAGQSHDATVGQLARARQIAKKLVNNLLPQLFLRRTKALIAQQLPKKSDRVVFCALTETQTEAYENIIESDAIRCIKTATSPCDCGSGKKAGWCCHIHINDTGGGPWRNYVFPYITHLMKICNHLAVLIPQSSDSRDKADKSLEALQIALPDQWRKLYKTRDNINNFVNPEFCGKWKVLRRLLQFWHDNGDKVLVFSHSVRLLKMLQKLFSMTSYNVSYLDGAMKYEDRAKTVDDFNSDPDQFVFLISTKAGGVGLNITSANKVVVFDPSWNPAHDLQAQDRAYRIGQTRDVEVFRLISTGTIEEIIYARQIYKQQQANIGYTASHERRYFKGVQEDKDQKGEIFGLINMFTFQEDRVVLREIVNKTNVAESKAGVSIADIDLSDTQASNDDPFATGTAKSGEDAYMSQLASQLIDEAEDRANAARKDNERNKQNKTGVPGQQKKKGINSSDDSHKTCEPQTMRKSDPVSAILASAGVEYSHFNSEVVGSSKIEASLSRRAEETGNSVSLGDEHVFRRNTQDQVPPGRPPFRTSRSRSLAAPPPINGQHTDEVLVEDVTDSSSCSPGTEARNDKMAINQIRWRYQPPEDVRRRQLCGMAAAFGFGEDVIGFALLVESWTQVQRRECLDRYYAGRRRDLQIGVNKRGKRTEDERELEKDMEIAVSTTAVEEGKGIEGSSGENTAGDQRRDDNAGIRDVRASPETEPWEL